MIQFFVVMNSAIGFTSALRSLPFGMASLLSFGALVGTLQPIAYASPAKAAASQGAHFDSLVGTVQVLNGVVGRRVRLQVSKNSKKQTFVLLGTAADELAHVHGMVVEIVGSMQKVQQDGRDFQVMRYRIIDIGTGARPLVGTLINVLGDFALRDGEGTPIPLSVSPRTARRLSRLVGAKVWIYGKRLLSGEIKVSRYGVLRRPPPQSSSSEKSE